MRLIILAQLIVLLVCSANAGTEDGSRNNSPVTQTVKERLSTKAADSQRVDDCKVPPTLRDPSRQRPTECGPAAKHTDDPAGSKSTK